MRPEDEIDTIDFTNQMGRGWGRIFVFYLKKFSDRSKWVWGDIQKRDF